MSTGSVSDPEDEVCSGRVNSSGPHAHPLCRSGDNSEDDDVGGGVCEGVKGPSRRVQRSAANARERARMRVLGRAFTRLRTTLPWVPPDTKLSKLDTLRLAASYITHLRQLLQEDTHTSTLHPAALSWPFMMSGRPDETKEISAALRLCGATA
ncbi:musculin [Astyanax mexicanus]|uniref:Musculin n=2 Tax=Astyanax mexicanus TaxID=7994 RepID=A0A3B1J9W3_ASTMX|nr:musculin [Astyanax mexicanus]KAG9283233.1 musculin [Astyanax mexicanus]